MRLTVLLLAVVLTGCAKPAKDAADTAQSTIERVDATPAPSGVPASTTSAERPADEPDALLPGDACTPDGYWSFFEAFVRTPSLREKYSDTAGRAALRAFDIDQQDSRWVLASKPTVDLDVKERRDASQFEVTATPVELDEDDNIVRPLGEARHYQFALKEGCWRFAGLR